MGGGVAAIDYDNDGRMDLFFTNGARLDDPMPKGAMPDKRDPKYWNRLYHQKADVTFEDASVKAGVSDPQKYYGLSSAFVHINEDKLLDLIVVNDSTPKQLYINKGDGTFEEVGYQSGVALNENGREQAGMGLGIGDYDNDGRVDFYITNFSDDSNTLYHNDGEGNFTDVTAQAGHGETTLPFLGWGTSFLDFDNDGWKDILVVNGHVYPGVDEHQWGTSFGQQPLLFRNLSNGKFERVAAAPGSGLAEAWCSRGLAVGDLDGDGRLDVPFLVSCGSNEDARSRGISISTRPALTANRFRSTCHYESCRSCFRQHHASRSRDGEPSRLARLVRRRPS